MIKCIKKGKRYIYTTKRKCKFCGEKFDANIYNIKKGFGKYCSKKCSNKGNGLKFKNGHPSYLTVESRKKISDSLRKRVISKKTRDKISKANKGRKLTEEHKRKLSLVHLKRWDKIGRRPRKANDRFKDSKYIKWRRKVFRRDSWVCRWCGQVGGKLEAHHIKSWVCYPKMRYWLKNGLTLCRECHKLTDNYKNKKTKCQI